MYRKYEKSIMSNKVYFCLKFKITIPTWDAWRDWALAKKSAHHRKSTYKFCSLCLFKNDYNLATAELIYTVCFETTNVKCFLTFYSIKPDNSC